MLPTRSIVTPPTAWPSMTSVNERILACARAETATTSNVDTSNSARPRLQESTHISHIVFVKRILGPSRGGLTFNYATVSTAADRIAWSAVSGGSRQIVISLLRRAHLLVPFFARS